MEVVDSAFVLTGSKFHPRGVGETRLADRLDFEIVELEAGLIPNCRLRNGTKNTGCGLNDGIPASFPLSSANRRGRPSRRAAQLLGDRHATSRPGTRTLAAPVKSRFLARAMSAAVPKANRLSSSNASVEAALYPLVKAFLERQGYVVRGEVRGCDLVARRGDEAPVIVELKLRFTLPLLLQGIDRLALSPLVYLAVPRPMARTRGVRPDAKPVRKLCRRLGLGLILIGGRGAVEVIEDPIPYRPRQAKRRSSLLLGEFERRRGDLNVGGSSRTPIVTAYRQDALRCVRALKAAGPMRLRELRVLSGVAAAAPILQRNVYGWFDRVGRGTYELTGTGEQALNRFAEAVAALDGPLQAAAD
jgi:hypothetical protein